MNGASDITIPTNEPSANFNRASAGYSHDTILAMLATVDGSFYCASGSTSDQVHVGERYNNLPEHEARILVAAARLRAYGLKVRVFAYRGKADYLRVYGPKNGGTAGRYSV